MRSLLSADFTRLKRDKFFWLSVAAMLIYTIGVMINNYRPEGLKVFPRHWTYFYFDAFYAVPLICAIFISLYVCKEFDNKTIRNKLIAAHSRTVVYISNLITCFAGSMVVYIAMLIGGLVAIPLFGSPVPGMNNMHIKLLLGIFVILACSSAATFISMASESRIKALITSIIIFFTTYIITILIYNVLYEYPFLDHYFEEINGVWIEKSSNIPNPKYVGGTIRTVLECIREFFPTGNIELIVNDEIINPIREVAMMLFFTLVTSVCGIFVFRKKDMR